MELVKKRNKAVFHFSNQQLFDYAKCMFMKVWKCDLQWGVWVEFEHTKDIENMTGNENNQI